MRKITKLLSGTALIAAAAVSISTVAHSDDQRPTLSNSTLVDLSHPFDDKTLFWPTSPIKFDHKELAYGPSGNGYFYSAYTIALPEHGGTHLDAPIHFFEGGKTVGEIPLSDLMAPVYVIDVTKQADENRDYRLTAEDVLAFEKEFGAIKPASAVLLRTGWSKYWPDAKAYMGDDTPGDASKLSFPSFGAEAMKLLVKRGIKLIGIDTASTDYGKSKDFEVHVIIAGAGIAALENLTNLEALPQTGAHILALPLKVQKGSGAPARVVGILP